MYTGCISCCCFCWWCWWRIAVVILPKNRTKRERFYIFPHHRNFVRALNAILWKIDCVHLHNIQIERVCVCYVLGIGFNGYYMAFDCHQEEKKRHILIPRFLPFYLPMFVWFLAISTYFQPSIAIFHRLNSFRSQVFVYALSRKIGNHTSKHGKLNRYHTQVC